MKTIAEKAKEMDEKAKQALIGKKIRIINMKDEKEYKGKEGEIEYVDALGQIHGTWGGCAVIPEVDEYEFI